MNEIKEAVDEIQKTWIEYKEVIGKYGTELSEAKERLEKMDSRMDELETKLNRPIGTPSPQADLESKAFINWARKGQLAPEEVKLLSTDVFPSGGLFLPASLSNRIIMKVLEVSPIRSLATVERIGAGDTREFIAEADVPGYGWTSERATRDVTDADNLWKLLRITVEEMYAEPKVTQKLLDDADFDVEGWLVNAIAKQFAKAEGDAFVNGNGVGKPRGLLTHPEVGIVHTAADYVIDADAIIDLTETLPEEFDAGARFLMRKSTRAAIRKLKNTDGTVYLWQPPFGAEPSTLCGYPITIVPDMPALAAASSVYPIVFGNIAEAYTIVDKPGVSMIRDAITAKGFVIFYTTRRVGGDVVNPQAILKLYTAAA